MTVPRRHHGRGATVRRTFSANEDATTANLAVSLLSNDSDPDRSDVIRITA
jgi:hypothetical protein